jgi:hypothetical protein
LNRKLQTFARKSGRPDALVPFSAPEGCFLVKVSLRNADKSS